MGLGLCLAPAYASPILVNPGFEAQPNALAGYSQPVYPGSTPRPATTTQAHLGNQAIRFDSVAGLQQIGQRFALSASHQYLVSGYYKLPSFANNASLIAYAGTTTGPTFGAVKRKTGINQTISSLQADGSYHPFSFTFTAASSNTGEVVFGGRSSFGLYLDDVSVQDLGIAAASVPEVDPGSAALPIAILSGITLLAGDKRRRKEEPPT